MRTRKQLKCNVVQILYINSKDKGIKNVHLDLYWLSALFSRAPNPISDYESSKIIDFFTNMKSTSVF